MIFLVGFMGSGKSTVGRVLSQKLNWELIDTDKFIEDNEKTTIKDLFAQKGEAYFREKETDTLKLLSQKKDTIVATGGGIVLKDTNVRIMRENGFVVLLKADADVILGRVKNRSTRPLINDNMNVEYIQKMLTQRESCYKNAANLTIDTENKSVCEITDTIIDGIKGA